MKNLFLFLMVGALLFSQQTRGAEKCGNVWSNPWVFSFIETNIERYIAAEAAAWNSPYFDVSTGAPSARNRFTARIQVGERTFEFPVTQAPFRFEIPAVGAPLYTVYEGRLINVEYVLEEYRKQVGVTPEILELHLSDGRIHRSEGYISYSYKYPEQLLQQIVDELFTVQPRLLHLFTEMVGKRADDVRTFYALPHPSIDPRLAAIDVFQSHIAAGHLRPSDLTSDNIRIVRALESQPEFILIKLQHGTYTDYLAMDLSGRLFNEDRPMISVAAPLGALSPELFGHHILDVSSGSRIAISRMRENSFSEMLERQRAHLQRRQ